MATNDQYLNEICPRFKRIALGTWLQTARGSMNSLVTAVTELMTDHAKNKLAVDQINTAVAELMTDHATVKDLEAELKTLVNDIRSTLKGDYTITTPTLSTGTTTANVASIAFDFIINGVGYKKAAVAAGTALSGSGSVPQSTYGAFALQIGADGTIDIAEGAANSTGYASAASALADLPAVAADHARMGTVTVYNTAGVFTPGTTGISRSSVVEAYANTNTAFQAIGAAVSGSPPATLAASTPTAGPVTLTASTPSAAPAALNS